MRITEIVTSAGNEIAVEGSDFILCRVRELVTVKLGGDNSTSGFLSSIITVSTTVAAAAVPGASAIGAVASVAAKAGIGLAGGMAQQAANKLFQGLPYEETTQTMSIHEFKGKYHQSG